MSSIPLRVSRHAVRVTLSAIEMQQAAYVGASRHIDARARNLPDRFGADPNNGWTLHIEGAAGEMAVSKALNRYWCMPVNTFRQGGDVGDWQIRTSSDRQNSLLVRPSDRDSDIFILVTGRVPHYIVHGYILARNAKQQRWLGRPGRRPPAYFVPQAALAPITDLNSSSGSHYSSRIPRAS